MTESDENIQFSTLIDELLNEDDKYMQSNNNIVVNTDTDDSVLLDKTKVGQYRNNDESSFSHKLWNHWLEWKVVRNTAIVAILFVIVTSPFFLSLCSVYVPFTVDSKNYTILGSFVIGTIYSLLCAFLMF